MNTLKSEIAATAAALVVEEGLEYGPAKRRALKQLALPARTALPDNGEVEDAVREVIAAAIVADELRGYLASQRSAEVTPTVTALRKRAAEVVELHYFAGLPVERIAELLGTSPRTIDRDWRYARAFLHAQFDD